MTIQEKNLSTKKRIVEAAQQSFAKRGFDLTGVQEICEKANVSKGAFYYHFKSKDELILYLLDRWLTLIDHQLKLATKNGKDMRAFFANILEISENVFAGSSEQLPVFLELWLRSIRDEGLNKKTIDYYRKYTDYFEGLIENAKQSGIVRDLDPETVSKVIISLVIGMLMQGLLDPRSSDWESVTEDAISIFFNGIIKKEIEE